MNKSQIEKTEYFRESHASGKTFVIPNAWDAGSARMLEGLGFAAIATTSSGFAMTKGRKDYGVTREEAIAHCRDLASAVDIPVSADLENGWAGDAQAIAETISLAIETGPCRWIDRGFDRRRRQSDLRPEPCGRTHCCGR